MKNTIDYSAEMFSEMLHPIIMHMILLPREIVYKNNII